ncbi:DUF2087 domain-containing protein [Agrobacterium vitis]|uniref:DUF2087 domain-containing protein n=1 Tax=Agrobacterium vitis TaxID=373 RepID=A0A6L6V8V2_AGRVI|nr:DUF2087 domain-containing protein [Agrobacterium vitis]MUZ71188.1 DUF2087 domain-containing protein [Agrobacterium vitis]
MSRLTYSYEIADISDLARRLGRELQKHEGAPGHVELLNMLARVSGHANFQHWKASRAAQARLALPKAADPPVDYRLVEAVARCFDDKCVLIRWPSKTSHQRLSLWKLWAAFPADRDMPEAAVNALLKSLNGFGDHVLLRREMVNNRLLSRTPDCRFYRRVESRPPPDALALIGL